MAMNNNALPIPENYADAAEKVLSHFLECDGRGNYRLRDCITSSKLRNLFGAYSDVYNELCRNKSEELTPEHNEKLTAARIRILYECGRDNTNSVKRFVDEAKIIEYLRGIGTSAAKFKKFYHYFEALVAYHRYYGGKD